MAIKVQELKLRQLFHQTTAHTLAFTFGLLALYPDEQERLFEHIKSVIPNGSRPVCGLFHLTFLDLTSFLVLRANALADLFTSVGLVSSPLIQCMTN